MQKNRDESHICKFLIVAHTLSSYGGHIVTTEESELGIVVLLLECLHKVRGMQIATCLSYYKVVFHKKTEVSPPALSRREGAGARKDMLIVTC